MTEPAQTTPPPPAGGARPDSRLARLAAHPAFISLLLAAATLAVFYPVVHHQFVSFDDPDYVTANTHVKGGLTLSDVAWAFRTSFAGNWHPLTWLSHMLDVQLFGLRPGRHHLTSLLLHAANTRAAVSPAAADDGRACGGARWWRRCSRCTRCTSNPSPGSPSARTC